MRTPFALALTVLGLGVAAPATAESLHRFEVETLEGERASLERYAGKVALVVNTASQCGLTPQYAELEELFQRYRERGLVVLAFPCNQFGAQEPGTAAEIRAFCSERYGVSFPLFAKLEVNGPGAAPLYRWLTEAHGGAIRWNFTKFLVGRDGRVVQRFEPRVRPGATELVEALEAALGTPAAPAAKPAGPDSFRTADYAPLVPGRRYTYRKTVRRRGGRVEDEVLVRTGSWRGGINESTMRMNDSEGEYQDMTVVGAKPAMAGQSMVAQGFTQAYEPALPLFPAQARLGAAERFRSKVLHRTRRGTREGSVTREVVLEGVERVETPAGVFAECLRFRAITENRPFMGFKARTEETIWLAPGIGEVRSRGTTTLATAGVPWMRAEIELVLEQVADPL